MRRFVLLLATAGCVDPGLGVQLPEEDFELAFIAEVEGDALVRTLWSFKLGGGVPEPGLAPFAFDGLDRELVLVGFTRQALVRASPLIDLDRLTGAHLLSRTNSSCAESFDGQRTRAETDLPPAVRVFDLPPGGPARLRPAPNQLMKGLRLSVPLAERPCAPPVTVRSFAGDGQAFEDPFTLRGVTYPMGADIVAEDIFSIRDADLLPSGEVFAITGYAAFALARGERIASGDGPGFWGHWGPHFEWPGSSGGDLGRLRSVAVLPRASDSERARILVSAARPVDPNNPSASYDALLVTLEYGDGELRTLTSSVVHGDPSPAMIDSVGRAIFAFDDPMTGSSRIMWTEDGLNFSQTDVDVRVAAVSSSPDPSRPHFLVTEEPRSLLVGDVTRPGGTWDQLSLPDGLVTEGLRSTAAYEENGTLRFVLGAENGQLFIQEEGQSALPLPAVIDGATSRTTCRGASDPCGRLQLPPEADWMTVLESSGHPRWFLYLPLICPYPLAVREDGCATHLPLDVSIPGLNRRSFHSLRFTFEGDRAIAAGSSGRLFELVLQP